MTARIHRLLLFLTILVLCAASAPPARAQTPQATPAVTAQAPDDQSPTDPQTVAELLASLALTETTALTRTTALTETETLTPSTTLTNTPFAMQFGTQFGVQSDTQFTTHFDSERSQNVPEFAESSAPVAEGAQPAPINQQPTATPVLTPTLAVTVSASTTATAEVTREPESAEPAPDIGNTEALTATQDVTDTQALTNDAAISTEQAVTITVPLTTGEALTISAEITPTETITAAEAITATEALTDSAAITASAPPGASADALAAEAADQLLDARVEELLSRMTVADRVGQLFVVTFSGNDTSFESAIAELIYAYRIGGVIISPDNGNFSNATGVDTPHTVAVLINQLQAIAYGILLPADQALQPVPNQPWPPSNFVSLEREIGVAPPNIPLLIGVQQVGDNQPGTALRRGFTPLPSQLAIGSTWNPAAATNIGATVGRELAAVGVNLLLGPNLDVTDQPRADAVGSLGALSFGGNAFWVGRSGRAYIGGVKEGSGGRVATIAGHFPGQGDVDRLPDEEVATIQRTLPEIQQIALPPFVAVTRASSDTPVTDGLMTSHMRFSALQDADGRNTPMSLDPELGEFSTSLLGAWRDDGVLMTGPLGVPAIRRYFDPSLSNFPARRVALDAFTAGHDLLYLSRFALDENWESQLDNYRATIAFFQERYRNDPPFAAQVDASVRRILKMKLRIYMGDAPVLDGRDVLAVPLSQVLVQESDLAVLPAAGATVDSATADVAREALTVLFPDPATDALPPAPQAGENIVIITDSRLQRECSTCTAEAAVDPDAIARIILALYGPDATGQIARDSIQSMTFSDLSQLLEADSEAASAPAAASTPTGFTLPTPTPRPTLPSPDLSDGAAAPNGTGRNAQAEEALANADWLIFAMLDVNPLYSSSNALRRFLSQRPEQIEDKRVVVFALNGPYFLDSTEISKLALYYGVYSKTTPFLETAVRALFRSFTPDGAPAVSAPSTRFASLSARLVPDPARPLPLRVQVNGETLATNSASLLGEDDVGPAIINIRETLHVEIGPILDLNGNIVADGTVVNLTAAFEGAELALTLEPATTRNGIAVRDLLLDRGGALRLTATSGGATSGGALIINVLEPAPDITATAQALISDTQPSGALSPTLGNSTTITTSAVTTTTDTLPGLLSPEQRLGPSQRVNGISLLFSLLTMFLVLSMLFLAQVHFVRRDMLFTSIIWAIIFGLVAYLLYAMGWLPGSDAVAASLNLLGAPLIVFLAMLLPLIWLQVRGGRRTP